MPPTSQTFRANATSASVADTKDSFDFNRFTQPVWLIAEVCNVVGILAVTWTVIGFIHFGVKTGKFSRRLPGRIGNEASGARPVYRAALAAFFSSYIRLVADQAVFNVGYDDHDTDWKCEIALDFSAVGYFVALICVYVFLWLKQRSLYEHPGLKSYHKNRMKAISWCSITVICVGVSVAGLTFVVSMNFETSKLGCVSRPTDKFTIWPMILLCGVLSVGQLMMLFLFLYPLRRHGESCRTERVKRMFRRAALIAVICVVSDMLALAVLEFAVIGHFTRHMVVVAYEYNLLVNLISVIMSFENWDHILFFKSALHANDTK